MTPLTYFVLHLITVPDIEASQPAFHRVVFSYKEDCIEMAQQLKQLRDPWVQKPNCVEVKNYIVEMRVPLRKPKGMP
jgi:hypothetical protein